LEGVCWGSGGGEGGLRVWWGKREGVERGFVVLLGDFGGRGETEGEGGGEGRRLVVHLIDLALL